MQATEIDVLVRKYAAGQLTADDAAPLLNEVLRLRDWLSFAEQNMTYPGPHMQLEEAIAGEREQPDYR